ncbi:MAG: alpha-1,4-glucan--maltose-1-phosphate maltosyltransferase [Chloroflexota bacterium]|nr:alpha-1,4-glucan--maltose-1-phosphate maltosyltransferase [Chloroflexota bacterium]
MSEACKGRRVVVEGVTPEIDCGRFPIKRVVGEKVSVEADIFADGYDALSAVLLFRKEDEAQWSEVPMELLVNDRWRASFVVTETGRYRYSIVAWVDRFKSWQRDLGKKAEAGQDISVDLWAGAELLEEAVRGASSSDIGTLKQWAGALRSKDGPDKGMVQLALSDELAVLVEKYSKRHLVSTYPKELLVTVDPARAGFSAWYEMFPRSCASAPGRHGSFQDCEKRLDYVARMGFDVLYLPPVHPIGRSHRKGKNNVVGAAPDDPGSPWAIGSSEGGHKAVHPQLGTLEDFRHLVSKAREYGIEVALDLAFHCTPDHPYVSEHPEWFRHRPDGSVQYAENPPKRYQDIYPLDYETDHSQELWEELKSVVTFWIEQGVRTFRVDNPHTKPFQFWQWLIEQVKAEHGDVIFLSEAFTRPKIMYQLAKLGFTQSYTYFAWRNTKWELTQYFTELTQTDVREYFRPSLWTNTPDILTEYLQSGGRAAFMSRLVLAATLGANFGVYGPAFELCENQPREPGSEEYLDSEKYEVKWWDIDRSDSLWEFIARMNRIRRDNAALQRDWNLRFHSVDNEELICYSKQSEDSSNVILVVVNLDPQYTQSGWVDIDLSSLDLDGREPYQVHDLLTDARFMWHGSRNFVELDPRTVPAHVFVVRRRVRTERDFEYYI